MDRPSALLCLWSSSPCLSELPLFSPAADKLSPHNGHDSQPSSSLTKGQKSLPDHLQAGKFEEMNYIGQRNGIL